MGRVHLAGFLRNGKDRRSSQVQAPASSAALGSHALSHGCLFEVGGSQKLLQERVQSPAPQGG